MSNQIRSYKDLEVWKHSRKLVKAIYQVTKTFPREERYEIVSQMRRAVISIPSNIAEGHARLGRKDFANFISIAIGSSAELETQVILCQDLEYLGEDKTQELLALIDRIQKMLHRLYQSVIKYHG